MPCTPRRRPSRRDIGARRRSCTRAPHPALSKLKGDGDEQIGINICPARPSKSLDV